jgi:MinD-like ATPase involved in chromosome partitioning or flagellar assembly
MTSIIVAIPNPHAQDLAAELHEEGAQVIAVCEPNEVTAGQLAAADAIVISEDRDAASAELLAACDRAHVRVVRITEHSGGEILAELDRTPRLTNQEARNGRVLAVWGPHGAPGRTTIALELATAMAKSGQQVSLVDADTYAPTLALLLGLDEAAAGIASACRRAETGELDVAELLRLSIAVPAGRGVLNVLAGLNRPSRWPELSAHRLRRTLQLSREVADVTIVDIAAATESDEELSFDQQVPRRNAATIATLAEADQVLAVASADPVGIARFLQSYSELRSLVGTKPLTVVANKLRSGPLGIDARGQIRRTLQRFAGVDEVHFLPEDAPAADSALLHAKPISEVARRSPLTLALTKLSETLKTTDGNWRESYRAAG